MTKIYELPNEKRLMADVDEKHHTATVNVYALDNLVEAVNKTEHWIETAEEYYKAVNEYGGGVNENTPYFVDDIACSECLAKYSVIDNETERFVHCPSCGAKMVESQESEDKK